MSNALDNPGDPPHIRDAMAHGDPIAPPNDSGWYTVDVTVTVEARLIGGYVSVRDMDALWVAIRDEIKKEQDHQKALARDAAEGL